HPALPGVPYLAGQGGLIDQLSRERPEAERSELMQKAEDLLLMSNTVRTMFIDRSLPSDLKGCIGEGVDRALFNPAFAASARAMGREVAPAGGTATREFVARLRLASERNQDKLKALLAEAVR